MKPSNDLKLDLHADADFAGLWSVEDASDPTSVKSHSGFVITLDGTPIVWSSKLQKQSI